jgi:hypothetical protein
MGTAEETVLPLARRVVMTPSWGRRVGAQRHVRNYSHLDAQGDSSPFVGVRLRPTATAFEKGARQDPLLLTPVVTRRRLDDLSY